MYDKTVHACYDMNIMNMRCAGRVTIVLHNHKITRTQEHKITT